MRRLNSCPEFRAKLDAISKSRKGKSWIGLRGGNGFITEPQRLLAEATGWPMEHAVLTAPVKEKFPSLPNCYKVDLAFPALKIAVEVDGDSHKTKKWKFLDKRKTAVLNALGWSVLRFSNEQVLTELSSITLKLKAITTTSPAASS
jgi:very-short-patch-repair endonuclease